MDFKKIKKIYMIGIKGVGMTMLAQFYNSKNIKILGSDISEKFMTDKVLKKCNIEVIEKFNKKNIPKDTDLIIYSSAYNKNNNQEVAEAIKLKKAILTYGEALGNTFNLYDGIGIVGSHGKTTTSAWLGYIMNQTNLKPNVMVGARVPQFNGSALINKSNLLIAELDEYQNKFKYIKPSTILLNNIDYDHPDFFPTKTSYKQVFIDLIKKIPKNGLLIANYDDITTKKIAKEYAKCKIISYSLKKNNAEYRASNIKQLDGNQEFKVKTKKTNLGLFRIKLCGEHNILNALSVIATSIEYGINPINIRKYLADFNGTERRMQILGKYNKAIIIDDYAHHPTEIKTTLDGVKKTYNKKNIICVFHPHTFTRTKSMINEFGSSFHNADEIIVLDIYGSAREKHGGINSQDIVDKIKKNKTNTKNIQHIPNLNDCEKYLRARINKNDVVLLMGAGDVFRIGQNLVNKTKCQTKLITKLNKISY